MTPTRRTLLAVGPAFREGRRLVSGAWRDLIWSDMRDGLLRTKDLPPALRALIVFGFALLVGMVGLLLLNAPLREASPLLPMLSGSPGRGAMIPFMLMPLTMFLLCIAWSFLLAGALRSRRAFELPLLASYVVMAGIWSAVAARSLYALIAVAALLAVPLFFLLRRRRPARPVMEFGVLLALSSLTFGISQLQGVYMWRLSGIPVMLATIPAFIYVLALLVTPLLLFIGLDIADFVHRVSAWTSALADAWLSRAPLYVVLGSFLLWRLTASVLQAIDHVRDTSVADTASAYAGALGVPLCVVAVWWAVGRRTPEDTSGGDLLAAARRAAFPLIGAYMGLQGLSLVLTMVAGLFGVTALLVGMGGIEQFNRALEFTGVLISQDGNWQVLVGAVSLAASLWFARRGSAVLALYLGLVGAKALWLQLTLPGRLLGAVSWSGLEPVDFWWTIIFCGAGALWLRRGTLTESRARGLLTVAFIAFLMRQTDFIEDPFNPVLGFTGIGIVAFGLLWDSLRIGFWANEASPGLPRTSRIFLYLGYVLFSVAVVNWAVFSHDIAQVEFFAGEAAIGGFALLGQPLFYALFAMVLLRRPATAQQSSDL